MNKETERQMLWKNLTHKEKIIREMRAALIEASSYRKTDDVNGEAGNICKAALDKIREIEQSAPCIAES